MTDSPQATAFKKFTTTPDAAGDQVFAQKLRDRVMVLRAGDVESALPWSELKDEDRAFIVLMKLPRRFRDVENCGCVTPERAVALLRGLHSAELLDTVEDNKARALIPVEIRKAIAAQKGQELVKKKLVANVYRPELEGVTPPRPAEPPPPPPPPRPAEPVIPPDIKALMDEADRIHPQLGTLDHFALLGIKRDAADADVKNAYLAGVRKWHPDRLAGVPKAGAWKPKLEAIFAAVGDANRSLSDKPLREAYLKDLQRRELAGDKAQNRKPVRAEEAKLHAQKGKAMMLKKDYAAAEDAFALAHECDPAIHEFRVEQAWAHSLNPAHPEKERRSQALEMLKELGKTTRYADTFYKLGLILRLQGDNDGAERAFRRALAADKGHAEAAKEIRIIEMRADKARQAEEAARNNPQGGTGGILDKFFKK